MKNNYKYIIYLILICITGMYSQSINPLLQLVTIEGGAFMMGSKKSSKIADVDEQKQHEVKVNNFIMNKLEVTVWEWKEYCKKNNKTMPKEPSWGWDDNNPITNITWYDAIKYCNWLSEQDGLEPAYKEAGPSYVCNFNANGYRLPTEAEWEYAAKGGKKSKGYLFSGSNRPSEVAWYGENSNKKPHSVGTKLPNELGIHDMNGNVWEWCWDWYHENYYMTEDSDNPVGPIRGIKKSVRGGSWDSKVNYVRNVNRISTTPDRTNEFYGFRLVKSVVDTKIMVKNE